jgi:PEP-CTERM motif
MRSSRSFVVYMLVITVNTFVSQSHATTLIVPGDANPWLAGMPNGSVTSDGYDSAPAQSPAAVPVPVIGGEPFTFSAAGNVIHGGSDTSGTGPEGFTGAIFIHASGADNGIASLQAPANALLGVFLDANQPSIFTAPMALDFSTPAERDFLTLSPELRQPFYIGDGLTSTGMVQQFIAPAGAARLFLGTMDGYQWSDNSGEFIVNVPAPEPSSVVLLGSGIAVFLYAWRQRRRP